MDFISSMLMATRSGGFWEAWHGYIRIIALAIMSICAIFIIFVVMAQSGNSSDISALSGGRSDTFYGKNKGKTVEHILKKLTAISGIVFVVLAIVFAIVNMIANTPV